MNAQSSMNLEEGKQTNHFASFGHNVREERGVTR